MGGGVMGGRPVARTAAVAGTAAVAVRGVRRCGRIGVMIAGTGGKASAVPLPAVALAAAIAPPSPGPRARVREVDASGSRQNAVLAHRPRSRSCRTRRRAAMLVRPSLRPARSAGTKLTCKTGPRRLKRPSSPPSTPIQGSLHRSSKSVSHPGALAREPRHAAWSNRMHRQRVRAGPAFRAPSR